MAEAGRVAPRLRLCRGCRQFVRQESATCPFCGGDVAALEADWREKQDAVARAAEALRNALAERRAG